MSKRPDPIEVEVGRRIRIRRIQCGMSQTELGDCIGVTFQQVQKYEKGMNRVGTSRLIHIAEALKTTIQELTGIKAKEMKSLGGRASFSEMLVEPHAMDMLAAFNAIESRRIKLCVVKLLEEIAAVKRS